MHEHAHEHTHGHGHDHVHGEISAFESLEQAQALMHYMLDHNRHHAEELHELCHKMAAGGRQEAADLIHKAVDCFNQGNALLEAAMDKSKE